MNNGEFMMRWFISVFGIIASLFMMLVNSALIVYVVWQAVHLKSSDISPLVSWVTSSAISILIAYMVYSASVKFYTFLKRLPLIRQHLNNGGTLADLSE
ncbi:MAG: hypothetical protein ABIH63_04240 [archaeon]